MDNEPYNDSHPSEIQRRQHRDKNVGAQAVVQHGYDADQDEYVPVPSSPGGAMLTTTGEYATKITVVGSVTYLAKAPVGSAQSAAVWQVRRIDESSGTIITWADGDANFDNVATDLTALSYS